MSAPTPRNAPTTGEQDGWAYVATGMEQHGPWVRHRERIRALLADMRHDNATQRRLTDELRLNAAMRGSQ